MNNGFNYYRVKTEWTSEREDGGLAKIKTEELVYASSYTEAEKVAYAIAENQNRMQFNAEINVEIVKTKIGELLYSSIMGCDNNLTEELICNYFEESDDTGVGLYEVKVMYIEVDEKTGKEKRSKDTIYTPALSDADASDMVKKFLRKNETRDFVIRGTKFTEIESILWSPEIHKEKVAVFDN